MKRLILILLLMLSLGSIQAQTIRNMRKPLGPVFTTSPNDSLINLFTNKKTTNLIRMKLKHCCLFAGAKVRRV